MQIGMINNKKKMYSVILGILVVISSIVFSGNMAYAAEEQTNEVIVDVEVTGDNNGQVKAGAEIEIVYKFSNLKNLYAASVELTYDNSLIKVNSIEPGEKVTGSVFEAYRDTAKDGNKARYAFTFLGGDEPGISGKADLVKIKATVIKDGELDVKKGNTKFQMVEKVNNDMQEVKTSYMNSQGQASKIEIPNKVPSSGSNPPSENGGTDNNDGETVTILGTNNSVIVVSEDEKSNTDNTITENLDDKEKENIEKTNENNSEKESNLEDSSSNDESDKEKTVYSGTNNTIVVISIISIVAIILLIGIFVKKRKNRN